MRISKFLPMICAAMVCANFISVRAQDNSAQAAARAALLEKMNGSNPQQNPEATVIATPSGATNEQSMPATNQPAVPAEMQPAPSMTMPMNNPGSTSSDTEAQAAARAALMQKMETPPSEPQTPISANVPPPDKEVPAMMPKAKAEQRNRAEKEAVKAAKKYPAKPQPALNNSAANPALQPIIAPPLPISSTKQARLQALTEKYKADQISPEEYFKQREAILAEPDSMGH